MSFGLIGKKLTHSKSPTLHSFFGSYKYDLIELEAWELDTFFAKADFDGLNVTIPYKTDVLKYCDELSEDARACGCVNTIVKRKDGTLYGDNTDWYGFYKTLCELPFDPSGKKALVLGTGGASLAIKYALKKIGCDRIVSISRSGENNYQSICKHNDASILINTTPLGTYPAEDGCPCNAELFPNVKAVIDLTYNPPRTRFIQYGQAVGALGICGMKMLVYQGLRSAELFTGEQIDSSAAERAYRACLDDMLNIVFVGMPGCGKTTIGRRVAERLGMDFVDTDELIEKKHGRSCSDIICSCGEKYFRLLESEVIRQVSSMRRTVISTGGGAILDPENRISLRKCSFVVHLSCDMSKLARLDRPLSSDPDRLAELQRVRMPLYEQVSDACVEMKYDVDTNLENVLRVINEKNTRY